MKKRVLLFSLLLVLIIGGVSINKFYLSKQSSEKIAYLNKSEKRKKFKGSEYEEGESREQDRPDLAALQHFEMTKNPKLGYPTPLKKVEAFEKLKARRAINAKAVENVNWVERGPNNVGGRTRALMFDPNDANNKKVFAGGISGGLWVTSDVTDENESWTNIDDFMASLSIATLAYDPNSTTTFYLGTGERYTHDFAGLGIWKSEDGGSTWTHLSSTSDFSYVPKIVITSTSTIIAATENGIKRSTDGGASWTSPATVNVDMSDVELASNGDLYAGGFTGRIFKSTDDGITWTSIDPKAGGQRVEIGLAPSNPDVIYALSAIGSDVGWLVKSTDGGSTWDELDVPSYRNQDCTESSSDFTRGQAWYDLIIGVHPTDENNVLIGGIDLFRSTDGGSNFELVSYWTGNCDAYVHADQHAIVYRPDNPNEAIFGNDGGVFYSADIGDAVNPDFIARNKNYNVTQFYAAAAVNEELSNEFLAGAQDNGSQRFLASGLNSTEEATGGDGAFCHIDQDDANFQITSYVYSNYYLSTDHGNSFSTLNDDNSNVGRFINPTEYDSKANILYGAAGNNQITRITDVTGNPSSMATVTVDLEGKAITTIKASPYTDNTLFVGVNSNEGYIFKIENADTSNPTVTNITGSFNASSGVWLSSIDVGESEDQLLITYSNYGVNSVFETEDGGANWTSKEGDLDDFPVYGAIYNPENRNEVLLATELGVWSTDDFSASSPEWEATNSGLANVSTRMIKQRESDGLIYVATHGRGLYTTYSFGPNFIAGIEYDRNITYVGKPINFINGSIGSIDNVLWTFGDGYTSTDNNPSHAFPAPGKYSVKIEINDGQSVAQKEIIVLRNRPIPYAKEHGGDFESNEDDFFAHNVAGTQFERGSSTVLGKEGTSSGDFAWVTGITETEYNDNSRAYLYSPGYDFSEAGTYILSFNVKYSFEPNWDGFIVEYTLDNGESWNKLGDAIETNWYNQLTEDLAIWGDGVPIFSGSTSGFETKSKDISSLAGNPLIGFRINFGTDANTVDVGMAIDDFEVSGPASIPVPNFLSSNPEICEGGTVTYNDNSTGTVTAYSWNFGAGATPQTATGIGPHEVTYASAGNYTTILTVTGSGGDVVESKIDYVTVVATTNIVSTLETNITEISACNEDDIIITVNNSDSGFRYQAFNKDNDMAIGGYAIGDGSAVNINLGKQVDAFSAYVKATEPTGCETILPQEFDYTSTGPFITNVTSDYSEEGVCADSQITFIIEASGSGIEYDIINLDNEESISMVTGDGTDLNLLTPVLSENMSLKITATNPTNDCSIDLLGEQEIIVLSLPDVTITQNGSVMEVPSAPGNLYQWFYQNEAIGKATGSTYNPSKFGDYTCQVTTSDGCTDISETFTTTVVGIPELESIAEIYPNPVSDYVNINFTNDYIGKIATYVYNSDGRLVYSSTDKKELGKFSKVVDVSSFERGIYYVKMQMGGNLKVEKIVVK